MTGLDDLASALIEGAPDGVVVSQRGIVLFANSAAAKMLGFETPEALVGASLPSLLDPEDAREMGRRTQLMLQTGERFAPRVYRANRKGGGKTRELVDIPIVVLSTSWRIVVFRSLSERKPRSPPSPLVFCSKAITSNRSP